MGRVLLAAGDDADVDPLIEALGRADLTVHRVETGVGALERLDTGRVECVLATRRLPDMDGVGLLGRVRDRSPDTPAVLLVGPDDVDLLFRSHAAGVDHVLALEPGRGDQIAERVQDLLVDHRLDAWRDRDDRLRDATARLIRRLFTLAPEELEREVCRELTEADLYTVAWVSTYDAEANALVPRTAAGIDPSNLRERELDRGIGPDSGVVVSPSARDRLVEVAVPFGHGGDLLGVLFLTATEDPTPIERDVLADLGEAIGTRLAAGHAGGASGSTVEGLAGAIGAEMVGGVESVRDYLDGATRTGVHRIDDLEAAVADLEAVVDLCEALETGSVDAGEREAVDLGSIARRAWRATETYWASLEIEGSERVEVHPALMEFALSRLFGALIDRAATRIEIPFFGTEVDVDIRVGAGEKAFFVEVPDAGDVEGWEAGDEPLDWVLAERVFAAHGWSLEATEADDGLRFEVLIPVEAGGA